MLRSRLLPWLFSAGLLLATACSDSVAPTPRGIAPPAGPVHPTLITLFGSVHLTGDKLYPVVLSTSDGSEIRLSGESANMLVSVDSAAVEVHGQWESDGGEGFFVADFLVHAVGGSAVIDGTLVAVYSAPADVDEPTGYAIRPTSGGAWVMISDPSPDLLTHLNERLWVAGVDETGGATSFGVIKEM